MASSWNGNTQDSASVPRSPSGQDLDILIVGKTGHGKSATAHSILGEECFEANSVEVLQKEIDGRKLLVVDIPGPSDTEILDKEKCRKKAEHDISLAVCLSPEGFHAILIVFRYGQRMTKGEIEAITEMKNILGEGFMRDHGVLIITNGDDFERKMKGKTSFKAWCEEQTGYMAQLLQECQNRCLLFNNRDENAWKQQRFELAQMIDGMKSGKRYKRDIFETIKTKCSGAGDSPGILNTIIKWISYFLQPFGLASDKRPLVDEMGHMLEELKVAAQRLNGSVKKKLDESIKEAEDKLHRGY